MMMGCGESRKFHNSHGNQLPGRSQVILEYVTSRLSLDIFIFEKVCQVVIRCFLFLKKFARLSFNIFYLKKSLPGWGWPRRVSK
jgi:hypothetical protein